jgi:hypothetical protein
VTIIAANAASPPPRRQVGCRSTPESVADLGNHLVESNLILDDPLVALVQIELGDEVRRVVVRAGAKPMQMGVVPPHCALDHRVQLAESQVSGQYQATPDWRLGKPEIQPDIQTTQQYLGRLPDADDRALAAFESVRNRRPYPKCHRSGESLNGSVASCTIEVWPFAS